MERSDLSEFNRSFRKLCFAFNRPPSDDLFDTFFQALERFRVDTVIAAVDYITRLGSEFPTPHDIGERCSSILRSADLAKLEAKRVGPVGIWAKEDLQEISRNMAKRQGDKFGRFSERGISSIGECLQLSLRKFNRA